MKGYLSFLRGLRCSAPKNFWKLADHQIPTGSGVYVLIARPGVLFRYPKGSSPVFYVGQATNLRHRLKEHLNYSRQARNDRKLDRYWPRYEYAASFAGSYIFIRTWRGKTPLHLEGEAIARFAKAHGSFPVANGNAARSWGKA